MTGGPSKPKRSLPRRLVLVGLAFVVAAVALVGLGLLGRQSTIDAAQRDAIEFTAPREQWVSSGVQARGLWVQVPRDASQFEVTVEDESGAVAYRRLGLIGSSSTLELDATSYRLDGEFDPQGNTYVVKVAPRSDVGEVEPLRMAIGPTDGYELPMTTVVAVSAGAIALLIGSAMTLAGLVQHLRSERTARR